MAVALAWPQLSVYSSVLATSRSFRNEKDTAFRFLLEKTAPAVHNSLQNNQKPSYSMTSMINSKIRSPLSRCRNVPRVKDEETAIVQFLTEDTPTCQEDGNDFAATVQRQAIAGEGSIPRCSTDPITLDKWLRDAVSEIVRNIQDAPFIQLIFDSQNIFQKSESQKLPLENLNRPDLWTALRDTIMELSPVGLVLVKKLNQQCSSNFCLAEQTESIIPNSSSSDAKRNEDNSSGTDIWGLLVEGKSIAWNACYILKTTRVESLTGTCTHFCLTKAQCCGPSAQDQLQNMWLL